MYTLYSVMDNINWALTWNTVLAISSGLMTLAIIITAIYAGIQLFNIKKTRCSDLLMRLHQTWDSKEYILSRKTINQYGNGSTLEEASKNLRESLIAFDKINADEFYLIVRIANFFENLGYLTFNGFLHRDDAIQLFGGPAQRYWYIFSDFVDFQRNESDKKQADAWIYYQYLVLGYKKGNRCLHFIATPISKIRTLFRKKNSKD